VWLSGLLKRRPTLFPVKKLSSGPMGIGLTGTTNGTSSSPNKQLLHGDTRRGGLKLGQLCSTNIRQTFNKNGKTPAMQLHKKNKKRQSMEETIYKTTKERYERTQSKTARNDLFLPRWNGRHCAPWLAQVGN
jgi:hypothetical protein